MKEVLEYLREKAITLTLLNYEGDEERLETLAGTLASSGVAVRTATTDTDGPANAGLYHRDDDVLGAVSIEEAWPDEVDFDALLAGETHFDIPDLVQVDDDVAVSPETTRERMVTISRNFERRALREGTGTLYAGFQNLSVLTQSPRTRSVYERLADAGVDVTVYGYPDSELEAPGFDVVPDTDEQFRDYWFLLYDGGSNPARKATLVSKEQDPSLYDAFWTEDEETVDDLFALAQDTYPELL